MPGLRHWLESGWYGARPSPVLRPLAAVFALLVALRRRAYQSGLLRSAHPGAPVIVVGNITVGGTGKTPLVLWLVQQLQADGFRVGVVCRGYGARAPLRQPRLIDAGDPADEVGDEALLLARHAECPVCAGVDRLAAARLLVAEGCQVVIADDGLQHYALRRDVEIAVIDGARGLGNGAQLPAGPLREPPARLAQVDMVVINTPPHGSAPADPGLAGRSVNMQFRPRQFVRVDTGQGAACSGWRGRRVHAVAGIGNPQRFFRMLRELGLDPVEHAFADHHRFRAGDLEFGDELEIVMTEKDAVKCAAFAAGRLWYLSAAVQFDQNEAARLMQVVRARTVGT